MSQNPNPWQEIQDRLPKPPMGLFSVTSGGSPLWFGTIASEELRSQEQLIVPDEVRSGMPPKWFAKFWDLHWKLEKFYSKMPTPELKDALDKLLVAIEYLYCLHSPSCIEHQLAEELRQSTNARGSDEPPTKNT